MCEFLSWTKYKGELYYLTNFDLNTRQGRKLKKELDDTFFEEIAGHGAIKEYFGLPHTQCKDYECTDFSNPKNFPAEIVAKIKAGEFSQIGIAKEMLTKSALVDYEKIRQPALDEFKKIWQFEEAEYEKIRQPAWDEYKKTERSIWDKHGKIDQSASTEYEKIRQAALTKYKKVQQPARTKYEKKRQSAFWELFSNPKNRIRLWR